MNELQIFNFETNEIRTITKDGEPWFVGKDVAEALGYSNSRDAITRHVDAEDKGVVKRDTLGGTQNITIVNESGLYALIFGSKLDSAKRFKRWVTSEVLPQIRKTGSYNKDLNPKDYIEVVKVIGRLAQDRSDKWVVIQSVLDPLGVKLPKPPEKIEPKRKDSVQVYVEQIKITGLLDRPVRQVHNDYSNFCKRQKLPAFPMNAFSRRLRHYYGICSEPVHIPGTTSNQRVYKLERRETE